MQQPEKIGQVISDQIQNFSTAFDSKLKTSDDKISKIFDEIAIMNNKMNQLTQRMQMFDKTTVSKDNLKLYSTGQAAVFANMEETIDEKYKLLKEDLHTAHVEWNVDKNK